MTSAPVVETSVTTTDNSPSQDYTHTDDQTALLHVTPGFKPFTVLQIKESDCPVSIRGIGGPLKDTQMKSFFFFFASFIISGEMSEAHKLAYSSFLSSTSNRPVSVPASMILI